MLLPQHDIGTNAQHSLAYEKPCCAKDDEKKDLLYYCHTSNLGISNALCQLKLMKKEIVL
jgi:hypothetical protein